MRTALGLGALVCLRLALDASRWLSDPARYWNWEEAYNAGVAWYVGHADLAADALLLQYKAFCGGCTVVAGLAAPLFVFGGDHAVVWKGLALGWTAATMLAGFWALDRLSGRPAAWAWAGLAALPPLGWSDGALMLWGNHQESALPMLLALGLAAAGRATAAGLVAGVGVWFCRTTLPVVPVVLLLVGPLPGTPGVKVADWLPSRARASAGFALGMLLLLLPAGGGDWGSYRMSPAANLFPAGLEGGVDRLALLVAPWHLAARLYPTVPGMELQAGAWLLGLGAGALALRERGWAAAGVAALFVLLFCAAGFPVPEMRSSGPVANLRYHVPWFFLGSLVVAASAGGQGWRRWVSGVGVAAMLGANAGPWLRSFAHLDLPTALGSVPAVSHFRFAWMATWRLPERPEARSDDPTTEHWLRRMEGYRAAAAVRRGEQTWQEAAAGRPDAFVEGLGQALTDPFTTWSRLGEAQADLAALPPDAARAFARGMAANLAFGITGGAPPLPGTRPPVGDPRSPESIRRRVEDLLARTGPDGPARAAVGAAVMDACRAGPDPAAWGACLADVLPADPEVRWGAGRSCPRPWESRVVCLTAAEPLALVGDAGPFVEGVRDPSAGMDRPFVLPLR